MPEITEIEFHSKDLSDFQIRRLVRASLRKYTVPITAFISDATIAEYTCLAKWRSREVNRWTLLSSK